MAHIEAPLRELAAPGPALRSLSDPTVSIRVSEIVGSSALGGRAGELAGRSVLLATGGQLTAALALLELDGSARRLVIMPPDIEARHYDTVVAMADVDAVVVDDRSRHRPALDLAVRASGTPVAAVRDGSARHLRTEWILMTSGTTGVPKLVLHDRASLTAALHVRSPADGAAAWGTFYDIRRYGGLQIFLRAMLGGASMVLSDADEATADHLARLARHGVSHLSGTPSQWRRALMHPELRQIPLRYVRLSGEIADQAILDTLRDAFPRAAIGHAYASSEAGVGFDVNDGLAGFPVDYAASVRGGVAMRIVDDTLRIRSAGAASRYLGGEKSFVDAEGFVDTGDMIERRGDRYYFAGRQGGIINIGGLKVHPEEIEAVINRHPHVRMSRVRRKPSPITGSIVVADVVLSDDAPAPRQVELRDDILKLCRETLPRHKVPAAISFVPALAVGATGKLARSG